MKWLAAAGEWALKALKIVKPKTLGQGLGLGTAAAGTALGVRILDKDNQIVGDATDAANAALDKLTGDGKAPKGAMETIKDFFSGLKFGGGSLIGAGLLGAVGAFFLKDPMLALGLAAVGAVAGQPLLNALMPEGGAAKAGAAPSKSTTPGKTVEPEVAAAPTRDMDITPPAPTPPVPMGEKGRSNSAHIG